MSDEKKDVKAQTVVGGKPALIPPTTEPTTVDVAATLREIREQGKELRARERELALVVHKARCAERFERMEADAEKRKQQKAISTGRVRRVPVLTASQAAAKASAIKE